MPAHEHPPPHNIVGFDESGNTGEDLLNIDQPVYALASVRLSETEVQAILPDAATERHFKRDRRSQAGRAAIMEMLASPLLTRDSVKVSVMHKRFFITGKIVDLLIEPAMVATGLDIYRDGLHLAMANLLHMVWPAFSPDGFDTVQAAFVDLCRSRDQAALDHFYDALQQLEDDCEGQPDWAFTALHLSKTIGGADIVEQGRDVIPSHLDPAGTALTALLQNWAQQIDSIEIHHDDSKEIRRWQASLEPFWNEEAPAIEFNLWNGETLRYPAPIEELRFVSSHGSPLVQVADIVAGAVATICRSLVGAAHDEQFAMALRATSAMDWVVGASIWATQTIDPEALGAKSGASPWLPDQMARWLAQSEALGDS